MKENLHTHLNWLRNDYQAGDDPLIRLATENMERLYATIFLALIRQKKRTECATVFERRRPCQDSVHTHSTESVEKDCSSSHRTIESR